MRSGVAAVGGRDAQGVGVLMLNKALETARSQMSQRRAACFLQRITEGAALGIALALPAASFRNWHVETLVTG